MEANLEEIEPGSFRFDGNSPLPLGMEWISSTSQAPGGLATMWRNVPRGAWSFAVSIPSWLSVTPPTPSAGILEPFGKSSQVILYRVVVTVRSPRGTMTSTRLLRRFSDFLKLHAALQKEYPLKVIPAPPPRHRLLFVASNNTLISQRRVALDAWLQQTFEDLQLSRSPSVAAFFDLSEAARSAALAMEAASEQEQESTEGTATPSATDGETFSSQLLEAYLSRRQGMASVLDTNSVAGSSGLPSPSPPSSLYRVLSGSSLGSMPPGIDLETGTDQAESEARQVGMGHPALAKGNSGGLPQPASEDTRDGNPSERATASTDTQSSSVSNAHDGVRPREPSARDSTSGASGEMKESFGAHERDLSALGLAGSRVKGEGLQERVVPDYLHQEAKETSSRIHEDPAEGQEPDQEPILVLPEVAKAAVFRHLSALHRRLQVAQSDMAALIERVQQEAAVSDFLSRKVRDVEAELDAERRQAAVAVQQAVAEREERLVAVEWELEEERVKVAEFQAAVAKHEERERVLLQQLQVLEEQRERAERDREQEHAKVERLEAAQEANIAKTKEEIERKAAEENGRLRGEVKALVREVKSLRKALASSDADAARARQEIQAYEAVLAEEEHHAGSVRAQKEQVLREIQVLAKRLKETAVTSMAAESAPVQGQTERNAQMDKGTQLVEHMELLSTSDARIELILAEARLLQSLPEWTEVGDRANGSSEVRKEGLSEGMSAKVEEWRRKGDACDREVLHAAVALLVENGNQKKSINALLRHAYASSEAP